MLLDRGADIEAKSEVRIRFNTLVVATVDDLVAVDSIQQCCLPPTLYFMAALTHFIALSNVFGEDTLVYSFDIVDHYMIECWCMWWRSTMYVLTVNVFLLFCLR